MRLPPACRRFLSVLLAKKEDELNAYVRGPLFPRRVFVALLGLFVASSMLTADWFGLLLLNAGGVARQIGILYTLRVTSVLLGAVSFSSLLLAAHYARLYTYTSEENVFFTTCFAISFLLGAPCALTWVFG